MQEWRVLEVKYFKHFASESGELRRGTSYELAKQLPSQLSLWVCLVDDLVIDLETAEDVGRGSMDYLQFALLERRL